jgi:hypothetical protein
VTRSMYPTDAAGKAMLWRHRIVVKLLLDGDLVDPHEALLLVVCPPPRFLATSLDAVREQREKAVA